MKRKDKIDQKNSEGEDRDEDEMVQGADNCSEIPVNHNIHCEKYSNNK